jgi:ribulose-phosphate 3-epimerase
VLPSLLSAPFYCLGESLKQMEDEGVEIFHYDVMDGHFVPNITVGPLIIQSLGNQIKSQYDVHLMVTNPQEQMYWFDHEKVRSLTIHIEVSTNVHRDLINIRGMNKKAGISLKPKTLVTTLDSILEYVDQVLVMTVNPGFPGQKLLPEVLKKIEYLSEKREQQGYNYTIQVDGGINEQTIQSVVNAGADEFVAGSAIFDQPDPIDAYRRLSKLVREPSILVEQSS